MTKLKILYNNNNYSDNEFPSKFENGEVKGTRLEINLVRNDPDLQIRPLDIVKIFKKRSHRKKRINYMVHACIYLGCKKICHAYYDRDINGGIVKIDEWDNFFSFVREGTEEKIICYRPEITFKDSEEARGHIAKCIEGSNRYFEIFGEFNIEEKADKKVNNCESLVNRCILGLNFSELADYRKKILERVFECRDTEINTNKDKLDSLITIEQVNNRINEINGYRNQITISSTEQITNDNVEIETLIEIPTNTR